MMGERIKGGDYATARVGLNPCCNGMMGEPIMSIKQVNDLGLNPCCNGMMGELEAALTKRPQRQS